VNKRSATSTSEHAGDKTRPEESRMNLRFLLGIRRPEETRKRVLQSVGFLFCFFAPLLFFLYIGSKYVLLDERLYYRLLYVIVILFFVSFAIPALNKMLSSYPLWMNLAARLGFCLPVVAALFSLALTFNCVKNNSVRTRELACLGKRTTLGSNPSYYVRIRPWNNSDREVEVEVPRLVFAATYLGVDLRVTTGVRRLGGEWIRQIDVVQPTSDEAQ
jgi:hypothetical protein